MGFDTDPALSSFLTRLVRNNGPLTRKIPFRTAPPPSIGVCPEYENASGIGDKPCHEMARNGTNRRSHQELVTTLVTNNGPLTRKIRFVTAPPPALEFVTNKRMPQELETSPVTN